MIPDMKNLIALIILCFSFGLSTAWSQSDEKRTMQLPDLSRQIDEAWESQQSSINNRIAISQVRQIITDHGFPSYRLVGTPIST